MSETLEMQKTSTSSLKDLRIFGLPVGLYAFFVIVLLAAHFTDSLPKNVVGGFAFMFVVGAIFGEFGKRLPIFNKYIGGAPVMIFLAAALFVHLGWLSQREIATVSDVVNYSSLKERACKSSR